MPAVILTVVLDRIFYGYWVLSAWNFLMFNFISGGSSLFGVSPFHWWDFHVYLSV